MSVIKFRRPDGHVYLTAERNRAEGWIHARWSGVQTLETVKEGGLAYVDMLREEPCAKLLNDHSELIGRFTEANEWVAQVWTPMILQAGLRYFAHVLSPGIFGQLSIEDLHQRIGDVFELKMFDDVEEAKQWLRGVGQ
ncbi:hypothetical protein [Hymenobacter jeollabukensis]|uniref:STAS/SEC14 domain-containing protein n=1 Tax=Hymenobacter jeollabukensis TaxID=2025313 RepID=A0A5R8WST0_9BACT|nr:hypothetical protein [Hymenobacter jeollabukensis]TLM94222.1 hypothetical protein FDY95_09420 [Hymenobacter jeollabukensis]